MGGDMSGAGEMLMIVITTTFQDDESDAKHGDDDVNDAGNDAGLTGSFDITCICLFGITWMLTQLWLLSNLKSQNMMLWGLLRPNAL